MNSPNKRKKFFRKNNKNKTNSDSSSTNSKNIASNEAPALSAASSQAQQASAAREPSNRSGDSNRSGEIKKKSFSSKKRDSRESKEQYFNKKNSPAPEMPKLNPVSNISRTEKLPISKQRNQKEVTLEEVKEFNGFWGAYGGSFADEKFDALLEEIKNSFLKYSEDRHFNEDLAKARADFSDRPTTLYSARKLSSRIGCKVYLKIEDHAFTSSYLTGTALGQILLAQRLGRKKIWTADADGLWSIAAARAASYFNVELNIAASQEDKENLSWAEDIVRAMGHNIIFLQDEKIKFNDAFEFAFSKILSEECFFITNGPAGPHPFPMIFNKFCSFVSEEIKGQSIFKESSLPSHIICHAGSMGGLCSAAFSEFYNIESVNLTVIESSSSVDPNEINSFENKGTSPLNTGSSGVYNLCQTRFIESDQNKGAEFAKNMKYCSISPEISYYKDTKRINSHVVSNHQAASACRFTASTEGLLISPESGHTLHWLLSNCKDFTKDDIIIIPVENARMQDFKMIENLLITEPEIQYNFSQKKNNPPAK
jgi:tryptophan synthase beta chain